MAEPWSSLPSCLVPEGEQQLLKKSKSIFFHSFDFNFFFLILSLRTSLFLTPVLSTILFLLPLLLAPKRWRRPFIGLDLRHNER